MDSSRCVLCTFESSLYTFCTFNSFGIKQIVFCGRYGQFTLVLFFEFLTILSFLVFEQSTHFTIIPRAPINIGIVIVLKLHIYPISILRSLYFLRLLVGLDGYISVNRTTMSFTITSGLFVYIFLSVWTVTFQRIRWCHSLAFAVVCVALSFYRVAFQVFTDYPVYICFCSIMLLMIISRCQRAEHEDVTIYGFIFLSTSVTCWPIVVL